MTFVSQWELAPLNSGAALNFIQAAVRYTEENPSANKATLKKECENCFKVLEGLQLSDSHTQRYEQLLEETEELGLR